MSTKPDYFVSRPPNLNALQASFKPKSKVPRYSTLERLFDDTEGKEYDIADHLPGPLQNGESRNRVLKNENLMQQAIAFADGRMHHFWEDVCTRYGDAGLSSNVCIPWIQLDECENPWITHLVLLNDPDDAVRIARRHVKKQPNFTHHLLTSIIATTDPDHWMSQRTHMNQAFLPLSSLAKIFPVSLARAKRSTQRLASMWVMGCAGKEDFLQSANGTNEIQIHRFLMHEAQAQLQCALFGLDESLVDEHVHGIRQAFRGEHPDPNFLQNIAKRHMELAKNDPTFAGPYEAKQQGIPVHGPLSKVVATSTDDFITQYGNMLIILFAGHDTTGNTMTFVVFELARHPVYQARVQTEVDAFFDALGDRDMEYSDLKKLPFMTKCIMEVLRLWSIIPAGTFRELQFDDYIRGPGGTQVKIPKGTPVQIPTWCRHRDPQLWGHDAAEFNPDRHFEDVEIWDNEYKAYNPASRRFSPFTLQPRDCIGRNFAQMEMRTILSNLFHKFTFKLTPTYANHDPVSTGIPFEYNSGVMTPRKLDPQCVLHEHGLSSSYELDSELMVYALPRQPKSHL